MTSQLVVKTFACEHHIQISKYGCEIFPTNNRQVSFSPIECNLVTVLFAPSPENVAVKLIKHVHKWLSHPNHTTTTTFTKLNSHLI